MIEESNCHTLQRLLQLFYQFITFLKRRAQHIKQFRCSMSNFLFFYKRIFNIKVLVTFCNLLYRNSPSLFVFNTLVPPFLKRSKLALLNRLCFRIGFLTFRQLMFPVREKCFAFLVTSLLCKTRISFVGSPFVKNKRFVATEA